MPFNLCKRFYGNFLPFQDTKVSNVYLCKFRSRSRFTTIPMAPIDCKCRTSYFRVIALSALSLAVYEKLKQNMKFQQFYLENDVNVKEDKRGSFPRRLEIVDSIQVFFHSVITAWQHTLAHCWGVWGRIPQKLISRTIYAICPYFA